MLNSDLLASSLPLVLVIVRIPLLNADAQWRGMRNKRNQVLLPVVAGLATEFFVMDFKIGHCATRLASPTVATQHLVAESVVQLRIDANACTFRVGP